jgi:hypothetical protein
VKKPCPLISKCSNPKKWDNDSCSCLCPAPKQVCTATQDWDDNACGCAAKKGN